ncbi:MFS transporter [Micromonospora echinofusca]|uniref:Multidrug efflux pump Tap n=1 Tax=Micromonospora echinofusca TaxID=47858 RepID=A0ABS3VWW9_MICEH|nr:MFS transporter [Micromonospora echinofusca]MBO4209030.1 MFS transporter [Micromonospora echinofusca]
MTPRGRLVTLISADIISTLGTRVSIVAIPWLVLETTGSPTRMGIVAAAETVPYILSSALAAPLADRVGLRRTSVVADAGSALVMAAVAAVALAPQLGFTALVLLVAVAGGLRGIGDRVKHVMLRPVAEAAGVRLIRLTSAYDGLSRGATLLGAALAGLLVLWFGSTGAIVIDAVSFAVCALLVGVFVRLPAPTTPATPAVSAASGPETGDGPAKAPRESYLDALRGGFRYLRGDTVLLSMLLVIFGLNMVANASIAVFIPLWVAEVLGSPTGLGLVLGAFAAGGLVGNLLFTWLSPRLPRYLTFVVGAAISGTPRLLSLALSDELVVVITVTFVSALGIAAVNPLLGVALYERVPDALQTRVIGIAGAVGFTGLPVGALLGGWLTTAFGLRTALLVFVAVCLFFTALPLLRGRPDDRAPEVSPTPAAAMS